MVFTFVISIDRSLCNIDKGYWYHNEGIEREEKERERNQHPLHCLQQIIFKYGKMKKKKREKCKQFGKRKKKEKSTFYLLKKISDKNLSCQIHVKAMGDRRKHVVIFE